MAGRRLVVANRAAAEFDPSQLNASGRAGGLILRYRKQLPEAELHQPKQPTFVGALLELLVVGSLLDEVEDGDRQLCPGKGVRLGVDSVVRHCRERRDRKDGEKRWEAEGVEMVRLLYPQSLAIIGCSGR